MIFEIFLGILFSFLFSFLFNKINKINKKSFHGPNSNIVMNNIYYCKKKKKIL